MDHSDILAGMDAADEYGGLSEIEYELAATRAQRDTLLAALKAVPIPRINSVCDNYELCDCWDCAYYTWFDLQRQAAIAAVEGE